MTNKIDITEVESFLKEKFSEYPKNIWIIGEREWSAQLARDFFDNHKNGKGYNKNLSDNFKGIFLLQSLPENLETFVENCSRLYFFNDKHQLFALKYGDKFLIKESSIKGKQINFKTITNIKYPKEYYKFKFASKLNVIPESLEKSSIFVILNKETGEWRFSHAL